MRQVTVEVPFDTVWNTALMAARESAAGQALLDDNHEAGEVLLEGIVNAVLRALEESGWLSAAGRRSRATLA